MQTQSIGPSNLTTTRLAYGCMRIAGTWNPSEITPARREHAHRCIIAAYEAGYTLFDHADIYCRGECEALHGEVLKQIPGMRKEIVIATKGGIIFPNDPPRTVGRYDFSYEHLMRSCEASLTRLGIETIDIYQLHRPDVLMDPDEICRAFTELHSQGKVRYFGVSNFSPSYARLLQSRLPFPLVVNQVEISLTHREPFFDGTLDQCIQDNLTPLSWAPLGGGAIGKDDETTELGKALDEIASLYNLDRAGLALAWLLKHPSKIIPIVGSADPRRIARAVEAEAVEISREHWYQLLVAAQGNPMP